MFAGYNDATQVERLVDELEVRGGQHQLIMFLSGPAGAGKSAAVKVARRFCFDFCRTARLPWSESTFLFTAYTGTAAMEVGGVTICKAAYIFWKKALNEDEKKRWREVKILIIDEISFMSDDQFQELNRKLQALMDNKNKPFGGISVIFAGNFCQLEPCGEKRSQLLFSRESSRLWDSVNTTIFLNNEHRFKEDPKYSRMMKTMWQKDLSLKD